MVDDVAVVDLSRPLTRYVHHLCFVTYLYLLSSECDISVV